MVLRNVGSHAWLATFYNRHSKEAVQRRLHLLKSPSRKNLQNGADRVVEASVVPVSVECSYRYPIMSNFGWSLADAEANPHCNGLINLRQKFLEPITSIEVSDSSDHATGTFSLSANPLTSSLAKEPWRVAEEEAFLVDDDILGRSTKPYRSNRPSSQSSDSGCFASEFPSLTSTGSCESDNLLNTFFNTGMNRAPAITTSFSNGLVSRMAPIRSRGTSELSLASSGTTSEGSVDCWRNSIQHAMVVMEHQSEEMTTLFDQLNDIHDDLASMNDKVGEVSHTVQQCQLRRQPSHLSSTWSLCSADGYRTASLNRPRSRQRRFSTSASSFERHGLTEDQMADIVHRLLTRICEMSLGWEEGKKDVPFII